MEQKKTVWAIYGVDPLAKRAVKMYAAEHDLTIAEALEIIIQRGVR